MKKFSIFIFLLSQWFFFAQNDLDNMLSNINQTSVTSGIIYERTLPIANLYEHNQQGSNHNKADYKLFRQALLELHKASNYTKLISLSELESRIANDQNLENVVNIGIINSPFHVLNYVEENPSQGGLLLNNSTNKFSQIAGKPAFYELYACLVAPLKEIVKGNTLTFKFSNNLILNNGSKTIKQMTVNFGDGVNRTIINNNSLILPTVNITNNFVNGHRNITFNLTFNDNKTLTTFGSIYTYRPPTGLVHKGANCSTLEPKDDIYNLNGKFVSEYAWQNSPILPEIQARVYYRTNNNNTLRQIRKPIIVVDGFDPGDKRRMEDCDCNNDPDCASKYTTGTSFNADKHRSIIDLMIFKNSNNDDDNMIRKLRENGFDVILVNHPTYTKSGVKTDGGADYIERNAMALATLIKYVNVKLQQNGSNEQLSIIGPSMGGQISKFALSWMEKKYAETNNAQFLHNARLWVSFDSTHHGANVPMGAQALLNFLKDESDAAKKFYFDELGSVASKQQLIEYHQAPYVGHFPIFGDVYNNEVVVPSNLNGQTIAQGLPTNSGNPFFIEHYNNQYNNGLPNSKGYPQNVRRVGITNGSLSGLSSGANSEIALDLRGFQRVCIKPFSWFGFGGGPSHCYTLKLVEMEEKFMAGTGGNINVARFRKMFKSSKNAMCTNINNRGNMDIVPGALYPTQHDIATEIISNPVYPWSNQLGSYTNTIISGGLFGIFGGLAGAFGNFPNRDRQWWEIRDPYKPFNSFVPTFSSIAHKNPNQNWNNRLDKNLVCTNETYFHTYFGESQNTEHITLNNDSVEWLLKELNGVPQAPWFPIQNIALTGPNTVCTNSNATFSFNDICKIPSSVTSWEVTPNLQIIDPSAYSLTVKALQNGQQGKITAIFSNGLRFEKNVWVGLPASFPMNTVISGPTQVQSGALPTYIINSPLTQGATSFEWWLPYPYDTVPHFSNQLLLNGQNWAKLEGPASQGSQITVFSGYGDINGYMQAMVKNDCGCGDARWLYVEHGGSGGPMPIAPPPSNNNNTTYMIYPNPSSSSLNIDLRNSEFKPIAENNVKGELFDLFGQSKGITNIINNKANISVQNLNKGVYVLKIYFDDIVESHQVIVQ